VVEDVVDAKSDGFSGAAVHHRVYPRASVEILVFWKELCLMRVRYRQSKPRLRLPIKLVLFALFGIPGVRALAQSTGDDASRAAARQLGEQGIQAYWEKDFASADEKLDRAYRLFATPTLGLWSARAHAQTDHWVEAAERYREATRTSGAVGDSAAQKQAQLDATKELDELLPRIPSLTIQLKGAEPSEVKITLDGIAVPNAMVGTPRPTNPGVHQLAAVRGRERYEVQIQLAEKEHKAAPFGFRKPAAALGVVPVGVNSPRVDAVADPREAPAPRAAASPEARDEVAKSSSSRDNLLPVSVVVMSLGGAGLIASGVTAVVAANKHSADCPNDACKADNLLAYQSLKTAATVSFYLGAAFAVGGFVTWLASPDAAPTTERGVAWAFGPGSVAVNGVF
jgi:hypothetical protein